MYLLKQENNKIVKYNVVLNREQIINLRNQIINECSSIIPFCYNTTFPLSEINNSNHIKNFKSKHSYTKKNIYNDRDINFYQVSFNYYLHSSLVELIDDLLHNDPEAIEKIYRFESQYDIVDSNTINHTPLANEIFETIEKYLLYGLKVQDVKKILEENLDEGTFNRINGINLFRKEILHNIKLEQCDEMTLKEYDRYISFYELKDDALLKPKIILPKRKSRKIVDF